MSAIQLSSFGSAKRNLILFPGWTHPAQKEPLFIEKLSKTFTIHSINLPGYINNPDLSTYHDFTFLTHDIHKELRRAHIIPEAFVGFSMGCHLITRYLYLYPQDIPCVFIGCPIEPFHLPLWGKILIQNQSLLHLFRSNDTLKQLAVNKALRTITQDPDAIFQPDYVTLTGAFDSLIGLVTCDTSCRIPNQTTYIYGEHDEYLQDAKKKKIACKTVHDGFHNCVSGNEDEIVTLICEAVEK